MEYSEAEKQMLREVLPGIAVQLRGALANIHGALGRLAPERLREQDTGTDRSAANRELLERLFWNLVSNAMKFTPPGGTIEVALRTGPDCVLLCVKDSGPGIPQDKLERLFDRWQHSNMDLPVHGLGLGLPLCRRIAQGHGGSLVVSSRQGEGTAVTVRLPDRRSGVTLVRQPLFHYAGGFNPVLVELADALPVQAFTRNYID